MSGRTVDEAEAAAALERGASDLLPIVVELEEVLAAEADALRRRDPAALLSAVEAKRRCLREADRCMAASARTPAAPGEAQTELMARLARCRTLNEAAGAAVAALQAHTEASLALLGLSPGAGAYGPSGRAAREPAAQTLVVC
ncbi:MAG TPA: flagellar export chaperone FlgN [Gammaproteobacteria bacterium]|nr:flagellar export chaperone FlgN [Gammaproteobacteria bacterium]